MIVTSISERIFLGGVVLSLLMLILTLILGRFFCGWVCPLGTVIDCIGFFNRRRKIESERQNRHLRSTKFFILGFIVFFSLLGVQVAWVPDPIVIVARFISLNVIPSVTLVLDKFFISLIKITNYNPFLYDFYHRLKPSLLGVKIYYFAHAGIILLAFLFVCITAVWVKRFWCRKLCPLGALYAIFARFSLLRRTLDGCNHCKRCKFECRMGAILDDLRYIKSECILCMDCIRACPQKSTKFRWSHLKKDTLPRSLNRDKKGITRRDFLFLLFSSTIFSLGFKFRAKEGKNQDEEGLIRPPAALREDKFLNRCIRCGNCMKVCPTNGLQPVLLGLGLQGLWTPHLVPEIGWCEYNCTLCGSVCPTGAIPHLALFKKQKVKLGLAKIDSDLCLPIKDKKECIVCEEHCPVPQKAIKLKPEIVEGEILLKPEVDEELCIGCGICQTKCPTRPIRAIRIFPTKADRT
jgi:ferredoxin-type protein NapF